MGFFDLILRPAFPAMAEAKYRPELHRIVELHHAGCDLRIIHGVS
jgi:hypothetical protein